MKWAIVKFVLGQSIKSYENVQKVAKAGEIIFVMQKQLSLNRIDFFYFVGFQYEYV